MHPPTNTKVITLALAALAAQAATEPSRADTPSASMSFSVTGNAVPVCLLGAMSPGGGAANATYSTNQISLTQFIDPSSALVNASTMTLQTSNAMCNYNAYVTLTSQNGGLTSSNASGVVSGTFLTSVPYTVTAQWGSLNVTLDTTNSNKKVQVPVGGANVGPLSLTFATQKSSTPVVQGNYQDTVTLTIGAAI